MFMSPPRRMSQPDDATTLMSDVWTFMAILGICLAVIFALIQSMPFTSDSKKQGSKNQIIALEKADELEKHIENLDEDVLSINHKIQRMHHELQKLSHSTKAAPEEKASKESSKTDAGIEEQKLSSVESSDSTTPKEKVRKMNREIEETEKRAEELEQQIQEARERIAQRNSEQEQTSESRKEEIKSKDKPKESREDQGFSLRFDSEQSLKSLLADDLVDFYLVAGDRAWKLQNPYNPSYRPAQIDATLYKMRINTVPEVYIQASHSVTTSSEKGKSYHVALSSGIQKQLNSLKSDASGGDLVIHRDGKVSLE